MTAMETKRRTPTRPACAPRGQALVETVVMLPILVVLILAIAYLKALTQSQARAIEAARYVTWETIGNVRGDGEAKTVEQLKTELPQLGLGRGLADVEVTRQPLNDFLDKVKHDSGDTNRQPGFFIPQPLANIFGGSTSQGQEEGFLDGLTNSGLGEGVNTVFDLAADAAVPIDDFFAYQTNWKDEADKGLFSITTTYDFAGAGVFQFLGPIKVLGHSSMLSHSWNIQRKDNDTEYKALVGDPGTLVYNPSPPDPSAGHMYYLWLLPSGGAPPNTPLGEAFSTILSIGGTIVNFVKDVIGAPGAFLSMLSIGSNEPGWHVPSGTLKEYPELHQPASSTGTGSQSGGSNVGG